MLHRKPPYLDDGTSSLAKSSISLSVQIHLHGCLVLRSEISGVINIILISAFLALRVMQSFLPVPWPLELAE